MTSRGAYSADRAAALSGVPRSTVHDWARKSVLVPSVSAERTKLWSYADLMGLRLVYWLRHSKRAPDGTVVPPAPMSDVRTALDALRAREQELWTAGKPPVMAVDRGGKIVLNSRHTAERPHGQLLVAEILDLVSPFESLEGLRGPDLVTPRPHLRIVPGKLGGEPHVERSRVETRTLAALARRGMGTSNIARLYPSLSEAAIGEAVDLERQLERNLGIVAAA